MAPVTKKRISKMSPKKANSFFILSPIQSDYATSFSFLQKVVFNKCLSTQKSIVNRYCNRAHEHESANLKNVVAERKASGGEMLARIASKFS